MESLSESEDGQVKTPAKEVAKKEGTTKKKPDKKAAAAKKPAKKAKKVLESLSESEDGQVTKILFTQFLTF